MKSGFIGIIGRPNVGKSTLLNAILGEKVAIATDKPQTTRNSIRGIYTDDDAQLVFIDTPGIHKPRNKLGSYMTETVSNTLKEVDVIILIVDDSLKSGPGDKYILNMIKDIKTPKVLVINKIDRLEPDVFKEIFEEYEETGIFEKIYGISALKGKNVEVLVDHLKEITEEGPMFFPADMVTDNPERFLAAELIRENLLKYLDDEVPHGVAVEIESFEESEKLTRIGAVIYCEKKSHKGIIIGKHGDKLKGIGKGARLEIEAMLGTKVYLELWVKVRENWRDSDIALSNFGYAGNKN